MMMKNSKLKSKNSKFGQCPFCNEKENISFIEGFSSEKPHRFWYVSCYSCQAQGPRKRRKKDALKAWENGYRVKEKITAPEYLSGSMIRIPVIDIQPAPQPMIHVVIWLKNIVKSFMLFMVRKNGLDHEGHEEREGKKYS